MENIGQLAATIFGFGFAFFAIWFHYDDSNNKTITSNIKCKLLKEMKECKKELENAIKKKSIMTKIIRVPHVMIYLTI